MKLTKIVLAAAALTAALVLAGCKTDEDPENAIASNGDINYTNDGSTDYYRSFVSTKTKHESSSAKITIKNPTAWVEAVNSDNSTVKSVAAVGYIFGIEKVKDISGKKYCVGSTYTAADARKVDFYNFGIASVRYNVDSGNVQWYVSWVKNAPDVVFGYNNSGDFTETLTNEAKETSVYGNETQIVPTSGAWAPTSGVLNANSELVVNITTKADTDGSYQVALLDENKENLLAIAQTIPAATTGLTAPTQFQVGRYVTVYKKQSVKANVAYYDMKGNLIADDDVGIVLE